MKVTAALVVLFASLGLQAQTYTITTVAGSSIPLPNNVPGTQATLIPPPYGVAVDSKGNVFFPSGSIVLRLDAKTGSVTVVAGNGTNGFSGDDGLATNAQLNQPFGLAVDGAGNLYIADSGNNRIRKVSNGVITTFASGLGGPAGVAADGSGNVFVADTGNNRILKIAGGVTTTVAGAGVSGFAGDGGSATSAKLYKPAGVAVDSAGNLYISDSWNNRIRKVFNGTITTIAGDGSVPPGTIPGPPGPNLPPAGGFRGDGGPAINAELYDPIGITLDSAGNIYFADAYNARVRTVSGGTISTVAGGGTNINDAAVALSAQISPFGVAVDTSGNLYIGDVSGRVRKLSNGNISTVAGTGQALVRFSGDNGPATASQLSNPSAVAIDSAGNIYIADTGNQRIRKVSNGVIITVAGGGQVQGDGGPATSALLVQPVGVAVDLAGNLYIADSFAHRIRKVSTNGVISTVAGTGTPGFSGDGGVASFAQLSNPTGVAVDTAGNLYIADAYNNRIRQVSATTGLITTVAGNGVPGSSNGIPGGRAYGGFSGDGGPAINAQISNPNSIAVDASGGFYFCDYDNNRVRRVSGGIITTVAGNATDTGNSGGLGGFAGDGGLAINAQIASCQGVALDGSGNLYVAANQRVREVSRGLITTIAGGGAGFGDNGPATASAVSAVGLAADPAGKIYLADYLNGRVRQLTPGTAPRINANGVVTVYSPLPAIQSGSWVSIYGTELAAATGLWNNDFPLSLNGTSVNIDGKPAALWFVSPTQINLQVPDDTVTGTVSVTVTTPSGSATTTATMLPQAPSLSLLGDNKHVVAQIVTATGLDLAGPPNTFSYTTRPVRPGETLVLYGSGFGATNPAVPSGKPFSGSAPTVSPVTVTIGGVDAKVTYSGLVLAGLYQINVTVPAIPSGDQAVTARVNNALTPPGPVVTIQ